MNNKSPDWTSEQIATELKKYSYWYHKIRLNDSITTPGMNLEPIWNNIRKVRCNIEYKDKRVLDIASFDGMFSFEAEELGAREIVATDCLYKSFRNFLFCREILKSSVVPFFNVSPYNLVDRLDVFFDENYGDEEQNSRFFDIVQHFGLLYHLQNPMWSISQARSVLKSGGYLIIETDIVLNDTESKLIFNGLPNSGRVRNNSSVWWAPTKRALIEMLTSCFFEVIEDTYSEIEFDVPVSEGGKLGPASNTGGFGYKIGRAAIVAQAVQYISGDETGKIKREILRTYRNPGLDIRRLMESEIVL